MKSRTRKPPNRNYEYYRLTRGGHWELPPILKCDGIGRGRWLNLLTAFCETYDGLKMALILTNQAGEQLLTAPRIAQEFQTQVQGGIVGYPSFGALLQYPEMRSFVAYRRLDEELCVPEFLGDEPDRHLIVPFSTFAYEEFITHLRNYLHPPAES